jgi:hypothetical protein
MSDESLAVRVTDMNLWPEQEPIKDCFNGVEYTFAYGRPIVIPLEAARHIFGFDSVTKKPNFNHVIQRWGWNRKDTREHAREWFGNLLIEPVVLTQMELPPNISQEQLDEAIKMSEIKAPPLSPLM